MLVALSAISAKQAAPAIKTMKNVNLFLDYVATYPDTILVLSKKNSMVRAVHSDVSYVTELKAKHQAGGICSSDKSTNPENN